MKNLVVLFFILAVMVIGGSSCSYRQPGLYGKSTTYYGKTSKHYGKSKKHKIKHTYWGRHKGGYSGHSSRGWYR